MKSTFAILFYIDRSKTNEDGLSVAVSPVMERPHRFPRSCKLPPTSGLPEKGASRRQQVIQAASICN